MQAARIFSIQIPRQFDWTSGVLPAEWWNQAKQPHAANPTPKRTGAAGIGRPGILLPQFSAAPAYQTSEHPWREGLVVTDCVSDGAADTEDVVGVELDVILDVVVVNLGADKEVVPNVVAQTAAEVFHEVITAAVIDAATEVTAGGHFRYVEARAGDADAAEEVGADSLGDFRLEDSVEVGQDGTVSRVLEIRIVALTSPPGGFNAKADAVLESDYVAANVDVSAALFRRLLEVPHAAGRGGRYKGATADHDVPLLSRG